MNRIRTEVVCALATLLFWVSPNPSLNVEFNNCRSEDSRKHRSRRRRTKINPDAEEPDKQKGLDKKTPAIKRLPEPASAESDPYGTRSSTENTGNPDHKSANDAQDDAATIELRLIQAFRRLSPEDKKRLVELAESQRGKITT
jgi:hypothetical protein